MQKNLKIPGELKQKGTLAYELNEQAYKERKNLTEFMIDRLAKSIDFKGKL